MIQPPLAVPMLLGTGLYAAWSDVKYRRLPNALALSVAGMGLSYTAIDAGLNAAVSGFLHGFAALLVGLALYSRRVVGGGDVKFYAAVAMWFPISHGFFLLELVSIAGLALVLGWLIWRPLIGKPVSFRASEDKDKLPFGVAIAAGAVLAAMGGVS